MGSQIEGLPSAASGRIFIGYSRASPDKERAYQLLAFLESHGLDVFIDEHIQVADNWPKVLQSQLDASDFLIVLLSSNSLTSPFVRQEIRHISRRIRKGGTGAQGMLPRSPIAIPIYLEEVDLDYEVEAYLAEIQARYWLAPEATEKLFDELLQLLTGKRDLEPPAGPVEVARFPPVSETGVVRLESNFYVERDCDFELYQQINSPNGTTVTITGTRRSGRGSLLARAVAMAEKAGYRTIHVDFLEIGSDRLEDVRLTFRSIASLISHNIERAPDAKRFWNDDDSSVYNLNKYLEEYVLSERSLLFLENVEVILGHAETRVELSKALRSWHNKRVLRPEWGALSFVITTSLEPHLVIPEIDFSPFNVGQLVMTKDFSREQVAELAHRHQGFDEYEKLDELYDEWVGGQPFLVRTALHWLAQEGHHFKGFCEVACERSGPFGETVLQLYLRRLPRVEGLKESLEQILIQGRCSDDEHFERLRMVGLVDGSVNDARMRYPLYDCLFRQIL